MKAKLITIILFLLTFILNAQQLLLLDRFNGNGIVNDSTITVFSSDVGVPDLTQYFTMKNNTDKTLAVFLRKSVNYYADSTSDYYCFGIRCWPGDDSTNVADSIPAGGEDYTFASHVTHKRRFDLPQPDLPLGLSSITYTVYDKTTFPEPVEASVTVLYHLSGVGVEEETWGQGEEGKRGMELAVFPNPASDRLIVETDNLIVGNYNLIILNSLGIRIENKSILLDGNKLNIQLSHYQPGIYFGRLISAKGSSSSFRFQVVR
jgi:hypothetical protein